MLVGEVLVARRGEQITGPDVADLTAVHGRGDRTIDVLWLGDSTAAAVGVSNPRFSVSSRVARAVSDACGVEIRTRVIAVSGAQAGEVVADQLPQVGKLAPDVVVVSVGANDTTHLASKRSFASTYRRLLDGLGDAGVTPRNIVMVGVPDMGAPTRLPQPLRAVAGWWGLRLDSAVRAVAREAGARYVDLFAATSTPFRAQPAKYLASDRFHPNDDGYGLWARAIAPVVEKTCR